MIANPSVQAFQYNPYSRTLSRESYDIDRMKTNRRWVCLEIYMDIGVLTHWMICALNCSKVIDQARAATKFGLILGTLGRQGNHAIVGRLQAALTAAGKSHFLLLLSEITPAKVRGLATT